MYEAKFLSKISNGAGYWSYQTIGVFQGEEQVTAYDRNYSSYGVETFAAFERNGNWYALYSPQYTGLKVMELPSGLPLGGEPCDKFGFCPVEVFIPTYRMVSFISDDKRYLYKEYDSKHWDEAVGPIMYADVAFVAGCVWGDDSSWKIEMRDISKAHEGVINKLDIGYNVMPGQLSLKESVRINDSEAWVEGEEPNNYLSFAVACEKAMHLTNGNIKIFEF